MQLDRNKNIASESCGEWEPLLVLFAAGEELGPGEQALVTDHVAQCVSCLEVLEHEKELLGLLAAHREEPEAALLANCRANLAEVLDGEEEGGWLRRITKTLLPSDWISPRPAWSAALLLVIGFSVGILGPRLLLRSERSAPAFETDRSAVAVTGAAKASDPMSSSFSSLDLHSADVAGINVFPSGDNEPPRVEVQMQTQQPITVQGTVDNDDVKRVLLYVLRNNERFDADVRLNAVDLLRDRSNDPDVRLVLCQAVHTDRNAAVRLKALEALNGSEPQEIVRQTLLDALVDDENPGVRVEAINALRQMAAKGQVAPDEHMLAVLRDRMHKDPNTYIRLQSAEAIRDLGPHGKF